MKLYGKIVLEVFCFPQDVSEDHPGVNIRPFRQLDVTDINEVRMEYPVPEVGVGEDEREEAGQGEEGVR